MAEYTSQCESCGGELRVISTSPFIRKCVYCGAKLYDREPDDPNFNRRLFAAVEHRNNGEFDEARDLYSRLSVEYPMRPQGEWGLLLCDYGIMYVSLGGVVSEDKPTISRSSDRPISSNSHYTKVLSICKDEESRNCYIAKAEPIEAVRRRTVEISSSCEPYDVFICYKRSVTDERGVETLTKDSQQARLIYRTLIDAGYKVFFAEETLSSVAVREYEPYIYNALQSVSLMIVVASQLEYVNAPWVRNEWNRFLVLMANEDKSRYIVPVVYDGFRFAELPGGLGAYQGIEIDVDFKRKLLAKASACVARGRLAHRKVSTHDFAIDPSSMAVMDVPHRIMGASRGGGSSSAEALVDVDTIYNVYLSRGNYSSASKLFAKAVKKDPKLYRAWWGIILSDCQCKNNVDFIDASNITSIASNLRIIRNVLDWAIAADAAVYLQILVSVLDRAEKISENTIAWCAVFDEIAPYCTNEQLVTMGLFSYDRAKALVVGGGRIKTKDVAELMRRASTGLTPHDVNDYITRNLGIGRCLRCKGLHKDAIVYFDKIIAVNQSYDQALWEKFLAENGVVNENEDYISRIKNNYCVKVLEKLIGDGYDEYSAAYFDKVINISIKLAARGNYSLAIKIFKGTAEIYPQSEVAEYKRQLWRFATVLLIKGQWKDALFFFSEGYNVDHSSVRFIWGMIKAYSKCATDFDLMLARKDFSLITMGRGLPNSGEILYIMILKKTEGTPEHYIYDNALAFYSDLKKNSSEVTQNKRNLMQEYSEKVKKEVIIADLQSIAPDGTISFGSLDSNLTRCERVVNPDDVPAEPTHKMPSKRYSLEPKRRTKKGRDVEISDSDSEDPYSESDFSSRKLKKPARISVLLVSIALAFSVLGLFLEGKVNIVFGIITFILCFASSLVCGRNKINVRSIKFLIPFYIVPLVIFAIRTFMFNRWDIFWIDNAYVCPLFINIVFIIVTVLAGITCYKRGSRGFIRVAPSVLAVINILYYIIEYSSTPFLDWEVLGGFVGTLIGLALLLGYCIINKFFTRKVRV